MHATSEKRSHLLAGVVLVGVAYWFFGANLLRDEAIGPMDLLSSSPGYSEGAAPLPLVNGEKSDILDSMLPAWRFVKSELHAGRIPQWDPIPTGGEPAITNLGYAFFTPRYLCFLLFTDSTGYTLGLILQLAIAGFGAYLLCRRRVGWLPALFGGATFMMCGFNASWTQWPQVSTSCWIPWMLWALVRVVEEPRSGRVVALAFVTAAMFFGGFPAVAAYGLYLGAGLVAFFLAARFRQTRSPGTLLKPAAAAGAGIGIAVLLAGVQVLPFQEYLHHFDLSHRRPEGVGLVHAWGLVAPFHLGTPHVETAAYAGILALALAALAMARSARAPGAAVFSPWFWLGSAGLTFVAIYNFPHPIAKAIYLLPVLSFNAGNRMTSILGVELAVLSALGLDSLLRVIRGSSGLLRQHAAVGAGLLLVALQCVDLSRLGRVQNAVVPAAAFFPARPTIEYVRKRILPGQSVLATMDAFFIPGTLGSYGLPEWFAHSYRTPAEKAVLEQVVKDPWATWTAAIFPFDRIDLQSPWIDALGIRFVMTSELKPVLLGQDANNAPSVLLAAHSVGQTFRTERPIRACAVAVRMATYGVPHSDTDILLDLGPRGRPLLARAVAPAASVIDNRWVEFSFGAPAALEPGEYAFTLRAARGAASAAVAAWTWTGEDRFGAGVEEVDGQAVAGDLAFQLRGCERVRPDGWVVDRVVSGLEVLERKDTPPGGYLVAAGRTELAPLRENLHWEQVALESFSPDRQVFRVTARGPQLFVRTMRRWEGWRAFVDGRETPLRAYQQILAAVEVGEGDHRVEFRYRPVALSLGLASTGLGLALCAALVAFSGRLARKPPTRGSGPTQNDQDGFR